MRRACGDGLKGLAAILAPCAFAVWLAACSAPLESGWRYRAESREEWLAIRHARRAYDGAPPVIPHSIAELGREKCLSCHQPGGLDNAERVAPARSHPAWGDCRQCHVDRFTDSEFQANLFEPLWWPAAGSRLNEIAPPMIPHSIQNREDCTPCHIAAQAHPDLRAGHGYRPNCFQCHVEEAP